MTEQQSPYLAPPSSPPSPPRRYKPAAVYLAQQVAHNALVADPLHRIAAALVLVDHWEGLGVSNLELRWGLTVLECAPPEIVQQMREHLQILVIPTGQLPLA